jgi:hypothetical protein
VKWVLEWLRNVGAYLGVTAVAETRRRDALARTRRETTVRATLAGVLRGVLFVLVLDAVDGFDWSVAKVVLATLGASAAWIAAEVASALHTRAAAERRAPFRPAGRDGG